MTRVNNTKYIVLNLFVLGAIALGLDPKSDAQHHANPPITPQGQEVTIGAQVWSYDRVYPLLDGLFQDVASTQVSSLTLNPNSSNSTQLDALVQSLQIQAGYNQLSGVQNSVAAQMDIANLGYQSLMAQQQQSILQQQITAQAQLNQAQQGLAAAQLANNAAQIATETQAVAVATANVNSLAAQMALIKGNATPWTPSPATGSTTPTLPTTVTSTVPATVLSAGTATGGPTFPATKQLDNQMDLLWSRLARVVGSMAHPDSMGSDDRIYLVEFDTATFPDRNLKKQLLDTTYNLTCSTSSDV